MSNFPEYSGMTYEQASREAQRLVERNGWFSSFDRLAVLRGIMAAKRKSDGSAPGENSVLSHRAA